MERITKLSVWSMQGWCGFPFILLRFPLCEDISESTRLGLCLHLLLTRIHTNAWTSTLTMSTCGFPRCCPWIPRHRMNSNNVFLLCVVCLFACIRYLHSMIEHAFVPFGAMLMTARKDSASSGWFLYVCYGWIPTSVLYISLMGSLSPRSWQVFITQSGAENSLVSCVAFIFYTRVVRFCWSQWFGYVVNSRFEWFVFRCTAYAELRRYSECAVWSVQVKCKWAQRLHSKWCRQHGCVSIATRTVLRTGANVFAVQVGLPPVAGRKHVWCETRKQVTSSTSAKPVGMIVIAKCSKTLRKVWSKPYKLFSTVDIDEACLQC